MSQDERHVSMERDPNYGIIAVDGGYCNIKVDTSTVVFFVDSVTPKYSSTPSDINLTEKHRILKFEIRMSSMALSRLAHAIHDAFVIQNNVMNNSSKTEDHDLYSATLEALNAEGIWTQGGVPLIPPTYLKGMDPKLLEHIDHDKEIIERAKKEAKADDAK